MKFNLLSQSLTVFLLAPMLTPVVAQAVPVRSPKCAATMHIQSVPNGAGVFFDDECKVAYVLPPQAGEMSLSAIAPSENLERCSAVLSTMQAGDALAKRLKTLADEIAQLGAATASNGTDTNSNGRSTSGLGAGGLFPSADEPANQTPPVAAGGDEVALMAKLTQLADLQMRIDALLTPYSKIEGATGLVLLTMKHQQLVAEYAAKNPGITFLPLTPKASYLTIASTKAMAAGDFSAALSVEVPGVGLVPMAPPTDGTSNLFRMNASSAPDSSKIFGESLSGQVRLSLTGACPFYSAPQHVLKSSLSANEIGAYLSANVQYSYELQVARSYKASYQLASLVRQIQSKSTHGGFFSTSTAASMIDDHTANSWFKLEQSSEDSQVAYDDLSRTLKSDLMDRVLKQVALATVGSAGGLMDPGQPAADGVSVAANGLRKNCAHIYCQSGAVVLDVLNSAFGSTSTVSNYISNNDYWASDEVTDRRMVPYFGSFSFRGK